MGALASAGAVILVISILGLLQAKGVANFSGLGSLTTETTITLLASGVAVIGLDLGYLLYLVSLYVKRRVYMWRWLEKDMTKGDHWQWVMQSQMLPSQETHKYAAYGDDEKNCFGVLKIDLNKPCVHVFHSRGRWELFKQHLDEKNYTSYKWH
jgi:hypothetical protein